MKTRLITSAVFWAFFVGALTNLNAAPQPGENIALGKKYTINKPTNYAACKDDADATQLTDGEYTQSYFWIAKTTVGWQRTDPVIVTIDLGADMPISGISYSTAAFKDAGVLLPQAINISVSNDNEKYFKVGELIKLNGEDIKVGDYKKVRFQTKDIKTHGRYLRLTIKQGDNPFTFIDEIEVYAGEQELLKIDYQKKDLVPKK